jgi:predicted translin family RNA/ssDNA-binding protein
MLKSMREALAMFRANPESTCANSANREYNEAALLSILIVKKIFL